MNTQFHPLLAPHPFRRAIGIAITTLVCGAAAPIILLAGARAAGLLDF